MKDLTHFSSKQFWVKDARQKYEDIRAEWNWDKYYGWLVDLMKNHLFV